MVRARVRARARVRLRLMVRARARARARAARGRTVHIEHHGAAMAVPQVEPRPHDAAAVGEGVPAEGCAESAADGRVGAQRVRRGCREGAERVRRGCGVGAEGGVGRGCRAGEVQGAGVVQGAGSEHRSSLRPSHSMPHATSSASMPSGGCALPGASTSAAPPSPGAKVAGSSSAAVVIRWRTGWPLSVSCTWLGPTSGPGSGAGSGLG